MKRWAAVPALFLAVALTLSGCSFAGLDAQTLMHAPKPTGENEADIQELLDQTAGDQIILKYPATGEYRSAILEHDVCGDQNREAIAFYQKDEDSATTNVMFMQKDGKSWKSIGTFGSQAAQPDRVCFGDLDGGGRDEVVVGWGSGMNNTGSICVYYYKDGRMNEQKLNQSYTDLEVMDFDGDGRDEIFTANVTVGDQPAAAHLLRVKDGAMEVMGSAPLDTGVTKYVSVQTGLINEKQKGVVLDGVKTGNAMVTELLYWDGKKKALEAPFYDPATKTAKSTARNTSVVSRDINGDKIIEIPIVTLMPGYTGTTADEADYLTDWHRYDTATNTFVRVMSVVIDYPDGYWFSVPDMWRGKITAKTDPSTRSFLFYQWMQSPQNAAGVLGPQLLKIEVFTKKEWESHAGTKGYFELYEQDSAVFAAYLPSPKNQLSMTEQEVREAFEPIARE
ncbi:MAG: VCBS repeat-containing protein [Oscillospiraceae bacterium]|jgi:hypothetical protein|nr:VCBS repeat-containing protein [Oscillospiraceae bacterium]MCI1989796.1 VCBS repeat-containing protein [Oscillospiraceae bacterium]MCI2034399.1 VCBS repeat-containing protein [Oscillospiraceae bacterium]